MNNGKKMPRERDDPNHRNPRSSAKLAPSADWRTENCIRYGSGPALFNSPMPPAHYIWFFSIVCCSETLGSSLSMMTGKHQFDGRAFFLRGGYFAFKYLNLAGSMRLRGTIFGGLRHGRHPKFELPKFVGIA
jgi:hypothetical protein